MADVEASELYWTAKNRYASPYFERLKREPANALSPMASVKF